MATYATALALLETTQTKNNIYLNNHQSTYIKKRQNMKFKLRMHKSKKAQADQIFIYIVALVVVGLVIVFGYKSIKNFAARSDEVALIKFKTEIENTFKTVSSSFNTVKIANFDVPQGYSELCLVDIHFKNSVSEFTLDEFTYNPLILEGVQEKKNVFLINGIIIESYYVGKIHVDSDISVRSNPFNPTLGGDGKENVHGNPDSGFLLCTPVKNSKVKLKLKGKGDSTFVSLA